MRLLRLSFGPPDAGRLSRDPRRTSIRVSYELPAVLTRGVYVTRYRRHGQPLLAVVDRRGEIRAMRRLPEDVDLFDGIEALARWLDRKDPSPVRLVASAPVVHPVKPALPDVPANRPDLLLSKAHAEIRYGWRSRGTGRPPRNRARGA